MNHICILILLFTDLVYSFQFNDVKSSFADATKEGRCIGNKEVLLFEHTSSAPSVVTEQWFTGGNCFDAASIITYYIDDDPTLTIEANLFMMLGDGINTLGGDGGIQQNQTNIHNGNMWATRRIGMVANGGGYYTTVQFPFEKSIRITLKSQRSALYWYIIRGLEGSPLVVGNIHMPNNTKLKLYKTNGMLLKPYDYVPLASTIGSGMLYMVTLAAKSETFLYLEACFRAIVDRKPVQFLSSGTEDFFLSAYYYNTGTFHMYHAGLAGIMAKNATMSAYKFFEDDPVIFKTAFGLVWRIGEPGASSCFAYPNRDGNGNSMAHEECIHQDGGDIVCNSNESEENHPVPFPTTMSSYTWIYEFENS